jgi:polyhydroxyalkanoate synthesis regulator phasin
MDMKDLRKYMEGTVGKLSPAKAQEMARSIVGSQSKKKEQVQRVAQDLLEWSKANRDRLTKTVRREVREQLQAMGVATRDEVDALKKRVRDLERPKPAGRSTAAKSASKTTTPKPSTAKRAAARSTGSSPGSSPGSPGSSSGGTTAS